ncbi:MAG: hypothetical protein GY850_24260 [bacterium]|nr:hypothetical protein [bacterium]
MHGHHRPGYRSLRFRENWNKDNGTSKIDEAICVGCGICADICPIGAISKKEAA